MKLKPPPPPVYHFSPRKPCFLFLVFLIILLLVLLLIPSISFLCRPSSPTPAHTHHQLFLSASTNATLSSFLRSLTILPLLPLPLPLLLFSPPLRTLPPSFPLTTPSPLPLPSPPSSLSSSTSAAPPTTPSSPPSEFRSMATSLAHRGPGISRSGVISQAESEGAAAVLLFREDGNRVGVERGTVMSGVVDARIPGWGTKEFGEVFWEEDYEIRSCA